MPNDRPVLWFGPQTSNLTNPAQNHVSARLESGRVGTAPAAAMGFGGLPSRIADTFLRLRALERAAVASGVREALLINWTEAAAHLGPRLRARGIFVAQVVAPQVFAWRAGRLSTLATRVDALAVLFRFEEALWQHAGVSTAFVGHPAAASARAPDGPAPRQDSLFGRRVALLPGSRAGEVGRLLEPLLAAARRLRADGVEAELLPAASLDPATLALTRQRAHNAGFLCTESDEPLAARLVRGRFDAAITASGTATLECALCGIPPVITYRTDRATAAAFRRFASSDRVGLPNVLLNQLVFPECLQERADGATLAETTRAVLRHPPRRDTYEALLREVSPEGRGSFGERVLSMLPSCADTGFFSPR